MKGVFAGYTVFFVLLVQGCGGSSSTNTTNIQNTPSNQTTELEGVWRKPCGPNDPTDPDTHYDIVTLTFSGSNFESDIENYSDALCNTAFPLSPNPTAEGTFTLGSTLTSLGGTDATEIDSHIDTFNGAPFQINDYGIFRIDGDTLYLEKDDDILDGSSSVLRNIELDYNRAYQRQ